jgi:opacity protein-like surface antigen
MRRKTEHSFLRTLALVIAAALTAAAVSVGAQTDTATENPVELGFLGMHQAGARLGGWSNQGSNPPPRLDLPDGGYYLTDFGSSNFYLEGFLGYRLNRALMLEFSLGIVSRGDVTLIESDSGSSIGTMQIYPILAKLRIYPFGAHTGQFYPYLMAGGGIYYGRHDIQITTGASAYYRAALGQDSETDFNYVLGGGIDWPVASVVALELSAQYMPVEFSGDLIGIRDYSSLTVTVGAKYLFKSMKSKDSRNRPLSRRDR